MAKFYSLLAVTGNPRGSGVLCLTTRPGEVLKVNEDKPSDVQQIAPPAPSLPVANCAAIFPYAGICTAFWGTDRGLFFAALENERRSDLMPHQDIHGRVTFVNNASALPHVGLLTRRGLVEVYRLNTKRGTVQLAQALGEPGSATDISRGVREIWEGAHDILYCLTAGGVYRLTNLGGQWEDAHNWQASTAKDRFGTPVHGARASAQDMVIATHAGVVEFVPGQNCWRLLDGSPNRIQRVFYVEGGIVAIRDESAGYRRSSKVWFRTNRGSAWTVVGTVDFEPLECHEPTRRQVVLVGAWSNRNGQGEGLPLLAFKHD